MVLKHLPGVGDGLHTDVAPGLTLNVLVLWVLTTPVHFYFGAPFHRSARAALRHCTFNMDVLVSLGTFAAYGAAAPLTPAPAPTLTPTLTRTRTRTRTSPQP